VATGCCGEAGPPLWPLATNLAFPLQRIAKAENRRKSGVRTGRSGQCLKFSLRAGAGPAVPMASLLPLVDMSALGGNVAASKNCTADAALLNKFSWDELRSFRYSSALAQLMKKGPRERARHPGESVLRRLVLFNIINRIWAGSAVVSGLRVHVFHQPSSPEWPNPGGGNPGSPRIDAWWTSADEPSPAAPRTPRTIRTPRLHQTLTDGKCHEHVAGNSGGHASLENARVR